MADDRPLDQETMNQGTVRQKDKKVGACPSGAAWFLYKVEISEK